MKNKRYQKLAHSFKWIVKHCFLISHVGETKQRSEETKTFRTSLELSTLNPKPNSVSLFYGFNAYVICRHF